MKTNFKRLAGMMLVIAMIFTMGVFGALNVSAATLTDITLSSNAVKVTVGGTATVTISGDTPTVTDYDWITSGKQFNSNSNSKR